jgi:hypothetical protein
VDEKRQEAPADACLKEFGEFKRDLLSLGEGIVFIADRLSKRYADLNYDLPNVDPVDLQKSYEEYQDAHAVS